MSLLSRLAKLFHVQLLPLAAVDTSESLPELMNKADALIAEEAPLPPPCVNVMLSQDLLPQLFSSLGLSDHAVAGVCTTWFRAYSRQVRTIRFGHVCGISAPAPMDDILGDILGDDDDEEVDEEGSDEGEVTACSRVQQLADVPIRPNGLCMLPGGVLAIATSCESYRLGTVFVAERNDSNLAVLNGSLAARRLKEPVYIRILPWYTKEEPHPSVGGGATGGATPNDGPLVRSHDDLHDPCAVLNQFAEDAASKRKGIYCRRRRRGLDPGPSRAQLSLEQNERELQRQKLEAFNQALQRQSLEIVHLNLHRDLMRCIWLVKRLRIPSSRREQSAEILVMLLELAQQDQELCDDPAPEIYLGEFYLGDHLELQARRLQISESKAQRLELQALRLAV